MDNQVLKKETKQYNELSLYIKFIFFENIRSFGVALEVWDSISYTEWLFDMQKSIKIAKSFVSCQPARTAQADMNRYFSHIH